MKRPQLVRGVVFLATSVAAWSMLSWGAEGGLDLRVGDIASRDYYAARKELVIDQVESERLRSEAEESVDPNLFLVPIEEVEKQALDTLDELEAWVEAGVSLPLDTAPPTTFPEGPPEEITTTTETTTTVVEEGAEEAPVTEPEPGEVQVTGHLFLDLDGDGTFRPEAPEGGLADAALAGVGVVILSGEESTTVESQFDGTFAATVSQGSVQALVSIDDPDFPTSFGLSVGTQLQVVECVAGEVCQLEAVGFKPVIRPFDQQVQRLSSRWPLLDITTVDKLVVLASKDVIRVALGNDPLLPEVFRAATVRLAEEFGQGVTQDNFTRVREQIATQPPVIIFDTGIDEQARRATGDIAQSLIQPNRRLDVGAFEAAKIEERQKVDPVRRTVNQGERIAIEGALLDEFQIAAIEATNAAGQAQHGWGLLAVIAVLVATLGFYLSRFRDEVWSRPRMVALLGLMIVLAAGAIRLSVTVQQLVGNLPAWYALPAVAFGMMAAVLFDSRLAILMAFAIAILAAAGTRDPGIAVYGLLATVTPIGFVSSISSRRAFRNAVVYSAGAVAVIAASTSWFFHTTPDESPISTVLLSAGWAFGASLIAGLVGLAALQFFEAAFDVTTTLRLLELTDRNHEALVLLQAEAFGSFNHSLLVGTLADAAARAIGANALLARAAAYFHDLGKTQNPSMFIENQFGIPNPHDDLEPPESVEIIRGHVTHGLALARRFHIPSEVTEGIVSHHGDGIMRFFFEKARTLYGDENVDPNDYRHVGHKPTTAEMAILMLADSLEAACRAVFQEEEPTPQAIEKVVTRVVDEKVNDGQLSESSLTLGQLTRVRKAFLDSLIGHYHQRIAYPNFPGT